MSPEQSRTVGTAVGFAHKQRVVTHMTEGSSPKSKKRQYRYGERTTWEIVRDTVREFHRPVTTAEIGARIVSEISDFALANLGPDLSVLSVNSFSRGNHAVNRTPRRTDTGNPYDRLIRVGRGRGVKFAVYDPSVHNVWGFVDTGDKVVRPRFLHGADLDELERARAAAAAKGTFDPSLDARRRSMAAIVQREGQPAFRQALIEVMAAPARSRAAPFVPSLKLRTSCPISGRTRTSLRMGCCSAQTCTSCSTYTSSASIPSVAPSI